MSVLWSRLTQRVPDQVPDALPHERAFPDRRECLGQPPVKPVANSNEHVLDSSIPQLAEHLTTRTIRPSYRHRPRVPESPLPVSGNAHHNLEQGCCAPVGSVVDLGGDFLRFLVGRSLKVGACG